MTVFNAALQVGTITILWLFVESCHCILGQFWWPQFCLVFTTWWLEKATRIGRRIEKSIVWINHFFCLVNHFQLSAWYTVVEGLEEECTIQMQFICKKTDHSFLKSPGLGTSLPHQTPLEVIHSAAELAMQICWNHYVCIKLLRRKFMYLVFIQPNVLQSRYFPEKEIDYII